MSTIANLFANLALAQVLPSLIIVVIGIFGIQFAMKLAGKALETGERSS